MTTIELITTLADEGSNVKDQITILNSRRNSGDIGYIDKLVKTAEKLVEDWYSSCQYSLKDMVLPRELLEFKNVSASPFKKRNFHFRLANLDSYLSAKINFLLQLAQKYEDRQIEQKHLASTISINASGGSIVGYNSNMTVTINVRNGNKDDLTKYLASIGISDEYSKELRDIIDTETPDPQTQTFGPKVSSWYGKMVAKAASGLWSVGTSAGGNLLATAIRAYFGWTV